MKSVVFGLAGSLLGALIWAAVVYFVEIEVGWVAWGVGGLVGMAVAVGNDKGRQSEAAAGMLAVVLTILSIVAGKYVAIQMFVPSDAELIAGFSESVDEEMVLSFVADDVAADFHAAGREVRWPPDVDPNNAWAEPDYPADVWAEAEARWEALGSDARAKFRAEKVAGFGAANVDGIRALIATEAFYAAFGPMDLIFFGLAIVTAFKLGSGASTEQSPESPDYDFAAPAVVGEDQRKKFSESDLVREPGAAGYCPSCGMQFRSGYQKCPDCDEYVAFFFGGAP